MELKKRLDLNELDYYATHLSLINCLLPIKMTPGEIKVLASFMTLKGDIAQYRFGPSGRKMVMATLGLSPAGLSNFIASLRKNGFLKTEGDVTKIWPILNPDLVEQEYRIKLVNKSYGTSTPQQS